MAFNQGMLPGGGQTFGVRLPQGAAQNLAAQARGGFSTMGGVGAFMNPSSAILQQYPNLQAPWQTLNSANQAFQNIYSQYQGVRPPAGTPGAAQWDAAMRQKHLANRAYMDQIHALFRGQGGAGSFSNALSALSMPQGSPFNQFASTMSGNFYSPFG